MTFKTGSEILYDCPRCNLKLGHTILAMVSNQPARVRCNTCKSERNYRRKSPQRRENKTTPAVERKRSGPTDTAFYNELLKKSYDRTPKSYRATEPFAEGDVIEHISFGKGVVSKLIFPDRMEVVFPDEIRVLIRSSDSAQA